MYAMYVQLPRQLFFFVDSPGGVTPIRTHARASLSSLELGEKLPDLLDGPAVCTAITSGIVGQGDMVSVECHKCHRISLVARVLGLGALSAVSCRLRGILALAPVAAQHVVTKLLAHRQVENAVADTMLTVECLLIVSSGPNMNFPEFPPSGKQR